MEIYMKQTVDLLITEQPVIAQIVLGNSDMKVMENNVPYFIMKDDESTTTTED